MAANPAATQAITISASTSISLNLFISTDANPTINAKYGVTIGSGTNVVSSCVTT